MNSNLYKLSVIILIISCKVVLIGYFLLGIDQLIDGPDTLYYHAYALGQNDYASSIWPKILRELYQYGLYSKNGVTAFNVILSVILIPLLAAKIVHKNESFNVFIVLSLYASLLFFSKGINRDMIMTLMMLLAFINISSEANHKTNYIVFFILSVFLFYFRPYIGVALLTTAFTYKLISRLSINIWKCVVIYFLALIFLKLSGALEAIILYRSGFDDLDAGSNLGINLNASNPFVFIFNFIKSVVFQLFGFYIIESKSLILFFIESFPFMLMMTMVIRRKEFFDDFCWFILVFFVTYSTIWCLGNDNLGTAIRLRIPSYISIVILYFYTKTRYEMTLRV